jgi:hypothetical protein
MMPPQSISVYLNNALKPTPELVELDSETALPDAIRDMPEEVTGHFVDLDPMVAHDIEAAWKRVMILNATHVLYTFTYDPATGKFSAHKRYSVVAFANSAQRATGESTPLTVRRAAGEQVRVYRSTARAPGRAAARYRGPAARSVSDRLPDLSTRATLDDQHQAACER